MHSDSSERSPQVSTDLFLVLLPFKTSNLLQGTFDLTNMPVIVLLRRQTGRCQRQSVCHFGRRLPSQVRLAD